MSLVFSGATGFAGLALGNLNFIVLAFQSSVPRVVPNPLAISSLVSPASMQAWSPSTVISLALAESLFSRASLGDMPMARASAKLILRVVQGAGVVPALSFSMLGTGVPAPPVLPLDILLSPFIIGAVMGTGAPLALSPAAPQNHHAGVTEDAVVAVPAFTHRHGTPGPGRSGRRPLLTGRRRRVRRGRS